MVKALRPHKEFRNSASPVMSKCVYEKRKLRDSSIYTIVILQPNTNGSQSLLKDETLSQFFFFLKDVEL